MDATARCFEVRRDDLHQTRIVGDDVPELGDGRALLRVDRFGFSSNNITYGIAGDQLGYWNFFPAADGWGRLPVWGFADVVASDVEGLGAGTRVFGYLPPATHLVVEPTRVSASGFSDAASHRAPLSPVYNRYQRTDTDPLHDLIGEEVQAIFAPLFITSFVLDDFLADNDDFGASQVVVSSASSKTAAGTALCTSQRTGDRPRIVGLTSPRNVEFVDGLGCYDEVVTYDAIDTIDRTATSVYVDVAGDSGVRAAVHEHLGHALAASWGVGMTHWDVPQGSEGLPGPEPQMFFAPAQIEKRHQQWGPTGYRERLVTAWGRLLAVVDDWVDIVEVDGLDGLVSSHLDLLDGGGQPSDAYIVDA